jgi:hypothetical protein
MKKQFFGFSLCNVVLNSTILAGVVIAFVCAIGVSELKLSASNEDYVTTYNYTGCNTPAGYVAQPCTSCFGNLSAEEAAQIEYNKTTGCGPAVISEYANAVHKRVAYSGGTEHIASVDYTYCYKYFPCVATYDAIPGYCTTIPGPGVLSCTLDNSFTTFCVHCCESTIKQKDELALTIDNLQE